MNSICRLWDKTQYSVFITQATEHVPQLLFKFSTCLGTEYPSLYFTSLS